MNQITIDIIPRIIESAYIVAPFDEGKKVLEKEGYHILSLEENARLRMQEGVKADVSQNGNWVKEDAVYIPSKGARLTKVPLICENAEKATNCHRNGKDYYLTPEQVERVLADSVQLSKKPIPANRFNDDEVTRYVFGNVAEKYGDFLKEANINEMSVHLADLQDKSFARKLWFCWLGGGNRSDLCCDGRSLHYGVSRVRGVKDSAEGDAKNFISLDNKIQIALKEGNAFEYNQILYVPVNDKKVVLKQ